MGRRNARWSSNVYEIFLIGEQLRKQMHEQGLVKDRRHHLRKHKKCFVARDVIDWLLKMHHVQSRDEAVSAMGILKQHGIFHHVTDEHDFKDQTWFYRFSFDDETYKLKPDLSSFYWGLDIYRKLKDSNEDVIQEFYLKGALYSQAFLGCDLVDFLVVSEGHENRDEVVARLRDLLERDIIKHVTDDYHFSDDKLIYEFNLDWDKAYLLQDVAELEAQLGQAGEFTHGSGGPEAGSGVSPVEKASSVSMTSSIRATDNNSLDGAVTEFSSRSRSRSNTGQSVDRSLCSFQQQSAVRFTTDGLEASDSQFQGDPESQFVRSRVRIECDAVGFGFVLGGSSPSYVQTVDPLGPAAAAGLQVRHFISSVNDQDVISLSHQQVGRLVAQTRQITLTVLKLRPDQGRQ
ncbi:hypothetical protein BsWGS_19691 [Bradybaena similaris]